MAELSRRSFLAGTAAFSAAGILGGCASVPERRTIQAGEKIHHACIGVGGMGWNDFQNFLSHPRAEIVALCDVDRKHLEAAAKLAPKAHLYADWRELLEKEGDNVDSVNAAVPDHSHAIIS